MKLNERIKIIEKYFNKNGVGAEIGVWKGNLSKLLLKHVEPRKLYLIDPYLYRSDYSSAWYGNSNMDQKAMDIIYNSVKEEFKELIQKDIVELIRQPSNECYNQITDNSLDWVYIDGDHNFEGVLNDLRLYFAKIKSGGTIICDDYTNDGWWKEDVILAVKSFLKIHEEFISFHLNVGDQYIIQINKPD